MTVSLPFTRELIETECGPAAKSTLDRWASKPPARLMTTMLEYKEKLLGIEAGGRPWRTRGKILQQYQKVMALPAWYRDENLRNPIAAEAFELIKWLSDIPESSQYAEFGRWTGCRDPVVAVIGNDGVGERNAWSDLTKQSPWLVKEWALELGKKRGPTRAIRDDPRLQPWVRWIIQRCNHCDLCAARNGAAIAHLCEVDARSRIPAISGSDIMSGFLQSFGCGTSDDGNQVWTITRTFASAMEQDQAVCRYADWHFRTSLRDWCRSAEAASLGVDPSRVQWLSTMEYGAEKGRRHYHQYLSGLTLSQLKEAFKCRNAFADFKDTTSAILLPRRYWPFGFIHCKRILAPVEAGYAAKYIFKNQEIATAPEHMTTRDLMAKRGEVPWRTAAYPARPALGRVAFIELVNSQIERLADEALSIPNRDPLSVLMDRGPRGIVLPPNEVKPVIAGQHVPPRPMFCRPQEKRVACDLVQRKLGWRNMSMDRVFPSLETSHAEAVLSAIEAEATEYQEGKD